MSEMETDYQVKIKSQKADDLAKLPENVVIIPIMNSPIFPGMIAPIILSEEKFTPELDEQLLKTGYIALQAESQALDFKNIYLLNLEGCMDSKAKNYKSYYIKHDAGSCVYE